MRKPEDVLTDSIYLISLAADLMVADLQRRLGGHKDGIRHQSKYNIKQMTHHLKAASHFGSLLMEEIFEADAENKWKNIQVWQDEANELARLILLWEDREQHPDTCNEIFKFIRSTQGDGVVDENMLKQYYLIKSSQ